MKAILGYILSGLGIVTLALSQEKVKNNLSISFLTAIPSNLILIVGVALIIGGIAILIISNNSSGGSRIQQSKEEVPIYEGEGKHRKIVGYRKN